MTIAFKCPLCNAPYSVKDEYSGRQANCKKCGGAMQIPKVAAHLGLAVGHGAIYVPNRDALQLSFVDRRNRVLNAFESNIEPVKVVSAYRFKILLVTAVMAALPIVYIGFIGLVGLAVLYHLTQHVGIFSVVRGRAAIFALLLYVAPIVIGGITIVFMFKPLFARAANDRRSRALTRPRLTSSPCPSGTHAADRQHIGNTIVPCPPWKPAISSSKSWLKPIMSCPGIAFAHMTASGSENCPPT